MYKPILRLYNTTLKCKTSLEKNLSHFSIFNFGVNTGYSLICRSMRLNFSDRFKLIIKPVKRILIGVYFTYKKSQINFKLQTIGC